MAYKQRWLSYFEVLDGDHNGHINSADAAIVGKELAHRYHYAEGTPAYHAITKSFHDYVEHLIKAFDANKDGKVTKEELLAAVEKFFIGKSVGEAPDWWKSNVEGIFTAFDANNNGEISLQEFTHLWKNANPAESEDRLAHAYKWAVSHSSSGKFDAHALSTVSHIWATSPNPTPEADVILFILHK